MKNRFLSIAFIVALSTFVCFSKAFAAVWTAPEAIIVGGPPSDQISLALNDSDVAVANTLVAVDIALVVVA